ncbi:hypothetical protein COY07_04360 [Candidatus Peregrinibacteria bacterium CG_4_10_14_0_2_um_filter_43_11]|nr:MAG: hypothetical protein COY07_04360 [Candidatus Peregrinibacteria bacterium CG_4_10_14_0_2_um_filter_43_11]
MTNFSKIIAKAPEGSGIYKFLNDQKEPLYVGKAKNLKKRLQSYFRASANHGIKTAKLLEKVESVEWIETNSEVEALILEDNLIKTLQPKYNILLKDDKNFQYIKVTVQDDYPEVYSVRRILKDGAKYFGPKTNGMDVQRLLESAKRIFGLCSVKNITVNPTGESVGGAKIAVKVGGSAAIRPCLDYHIKRCTGPCAGMVTPEEYRKQINAAIDFLSGDYKVAIDSLKSQMTQYALEKKFERAAALRDQINAIERSAHKQLITDTTLVSRDVIAFVEDLGKNYFILFQSRGGKLIAEERFVSEGGEAAPEVMEAFLREYYALAADIPKEIVISVEPEEKTTLTEYIKGHTDHTVKLIHPKIGQKDDLIALAEKNARSFAEASRVSWEAAEKRAEIALEELKKVLKLPELPKRIECYDISHLGGTETVGSMVVFKKGKPANVDYRQFRLRTTVNQNDDFKSINEVITRRLNYLPEQLPEGYRIRKAKKADFPFIEETCKKEPVNDWNLNVKHFFVIEKNKKIVGFIRLHPLDDSVDDLSSLWVAKEERGQKLGHHLITKAIESSKHGRVYIDVVKELEEYYLKLEFEVLRQPPQAMLDKITRLKKDKRAWKKAETLRGKNFELVFMVYQKKKRDLSFSARPDLMVIDGGKGQLSSALKAMEEKGIAIPLISLAKEKEKVFVPGKSDPLNLKNNSEGSYLLQRIRDEAHRFAISFNRSSRDKKMTQSVLDTIPGVGPKLKKRLLTHFGSVPRIREASLDKLTPICGEGIAVKIKEGL